MNLPCVPRALFRLGRVGLHLLTGMVVLKLVYPRCRPARQAQLKRRWAAQLLDMLGVSLAVGGSPRAAMRVANHVSWLDIFVIMAHRPATFVAKEDVRGWPLIGWLCARSGTVFIRRGSRRAAQATVAALAGALLAGDEIVAFPEGTTTDGGTVLPFHGALLQGALSAGQAVQPMVLSYAGVDGRRTTAPAYWADISLPQSLWRVACADGIVASLGYLAPHDMDGVDRRALAALLRGDIAAALRTRWPVPAASAELGTADELTDSGSALAADW